MPIDLRRTLVWATAAAALAGALVLTANDGAAWRLETASAAAERPRDATTPMPSSVGRSPPATSRAP